jgi:hypothetical protein
VPAHRLAVHAALSIESAERHGSSWPVLARTDAGDFLTKLRGAAQGVLPLIAEIIVGELATALGLPVPARAIVSLDEDTPSEDRRDELLDLLARSRGMNLGFRYLPDAIDLPPVERWRVPAEFAGTVLWLDGLVMNADRTPQNPNIVLWHRQPWLIDHGAALSFHFDLPRLTEQTPREPLFAPSRHLFAEHAAAALGMDEENARKLSRDALAAAAAAVPDDFLHTAFPRTTPDAMRGVYATFLWKRLKPPRPFLPATTPVR